MHTDVRMRECISLCHDCASICLETMRHCLEKGGHHAESAHIVLLADCAQICETSAGFMARGSERHAVTCRACEEICRACARSCSSMAGDAEMERCAAICNRCAESCRQMAV
jgi:hypothetical protein